MPSPLDIRNVSHSRRVIWLACDAKIGPGVGRWIVEYLEDQDPDGDDNSSLEWFARDLLAISQQVRP